MTRRLTAIIQREADGYVSLCPELDIASQGDTVERARENLKEALDLFFETASLKPAGRIDDVHNLSGSLSTALSIPLRNPFISEICLRGIISILLP